MVNASENKKIVVAAALIDDGLGRLLLVRKAGTPWFMQAGGKIGENETALAALRRELTEEIGLSVVEEQMQYLGRFSAPAANEPDSVVEAEVFHLRVQCIPGLHAEIEEAIWVSQAEAAVMPLAPLTRNHILPLSEILKVSV